MRRTVVPATANLLDENFTGSNGTPAGFADADWTNSDAANFCDPDCGTVAPDTTGGSCGSGTGWSGDCLLTTQSGGESISVYNTFAAQTGDVYFKGRLRLTFTIGTDGQQYPIASLTDATPSYPGTVNNLVVRIIRTAGPVYSIGVVHALSTSGSITPVSVTSSTGPTDTHCIEMYVNNSTNAYQVWVDGTALCTASCSDANFDIDPAVLMLGNNQGNGGSSITMAWDEVQVGNTGRLGPCAP